MIDLRDSIVILGGGLTASFAANEFLKSNFKVVMIDAGYDAEDNINVSKIKKADLPPSYKFKIKSKEYIYKNFASKLKVETKNFHLIGSLALGGLSNIWGGGLSKFNEYDHEYDHEEIEKIYKEIQMEMQGLSNDQKSSFNYDEDDFRLKRLFNRNNKGIKYFQPINAVLSNDSSHQNHKHKIYSADILIDKLKEKRNFKIISNSFINSVSRNEDEYILKTENKLDGQQEEYLLKNVFCGLGVISTTKLVLQMEQAYDSPLPLKTTPLGYFLIFSMNKRKNSTKFGLSSLSFSCEDQSNPCTGGIFPCNEEILSYYKFFNQLPKFLRILIDKVLLQRIFIGNVFFSSSMSLNQISLMKNGKCFIQGKNHPDLEKNFKKVKKILGQSLKDFKMLLVPGFGKLASPGGDIHYAGTLPIDTKNKKKLCCNRFGKLNGHENFHIVDASIINALPGKPHTLHSLAQTILISREFIASNSDVSL